MSDASNIVGIHGQPVMQERRPNDLIIKRLEWLLEAARAGEVVGLASAYVFHDGSSQFTINGVISYSMVGALHASLVDAANEIMERNR